MYNFQVNDIAAFEYNGEPRRVQVKKVGLDYIQCDNLTDMGVAPKRPHATYSFNKIQNPLINVRNGVTVQ